MVSRPALISATVAAALIFPIHLAAEELVAEQPLVEDFADAKYSPLLELRRETLVLRAPVLLAQRVEMVSSFPVDSEGEQFVHEPALNSLVRAGLHFNSGLEFAPVGVGADFEIDAISGLFYGGGTPLGDYTPDTRAGDTAVIRKASARFSIGRQVHLNAGLMTSLWGMGLLANDGAQTWEPGSARFTDPRGGNRVLRGLVAFGPFTRGSLLIAAGADRVVEDDALFEGDEAHQGVLSVMYGHLTPSRVGVYAVRRLQNLDGGGETNIWALNTTAAHVMAIGEKATLDLEVEAAFITGTTTLSPTTQFQVSDVRQFGAAARAGLDFGPAGAVLDLLYASGDHNFSDGRQTAFKADSNYHMGLLLHRYVVAAQTSRTTVTAADPDLAAFPPPDLDRYPSAGMITNTISIFPRGWWRPIGGLEIYGGPLIAFAPARQADPYHTNLAGGEPHNSLGAQASRYLGTELDLGIRYRQLLRNTELVAGIEAATFLPGAAFNDGDSRESMSAVHGGRAMIEYRF